jgi:hypothetical protein
MAKPKVRRAVIREWMTLAPQKRQSGEQALAFARLRSSDTTCHVVAERRTK